MNLTQILEMLPPRVYLRSGELVIQFSSPADLVSRVLETSSAFAQIDPSTEGRQERTGRRAMNRLPAGSSPSVPTAEEPAARQQQES